MANVKENYLEWSLKHLSRFSHSDFFPKIAEFKAISHNWKGVKSHILSIDLEHYVPKSPMILITPKPNGTFRIVHQLDPIDSLIYTALVRELCEAIEKFRILEEKGIACSYRIKPDLNGSFFSSDTGWETYMSRSEELAKKFESGYVINADITDFYNQIYTHRVQNLVENAGEGALDEQAKSLERFLLGLNNKTSRGVPVGPSPSIILAELIMADIDKKIQTYTSDFVRYVDDMRLFFEKREDAVFALHELTAYLYSNHRLTFSGEKTKILTTREFRDRHLRDEEREVRAGLLSHAEELAIGKMDDRLSELGPYDEDFDYDQEKQELLDELMTSVHFPLLADTYKDLFDQAVTSSPIDLQLLRHLLRKAARYRIRSIAPLVLEHFQKLLPILREVVIYLKQVLNKEFVITHKQYFE